MEWIYKYFSITAVIAGLGFLIKYLIQKKIDSYFNTKLENHKKELAVMTEKAKYDISKKLFDFEAYAMKKHTVYPELYQLVFEIGQQLLQFSYRMEKLSYTRDTREKEIFLNEINQLDSTVGNAQVYFKKNQLFLSKQLASTLSEIFNEIFMISAYCYTEKYENYDPSIVNEEVSLIELKIDLLKEDMYAELSYSHFEETEEKV